MAKLNILVIGGSGFIGFPLVKKLLEAGHKVTNLNRGKKQSKGHSNLIEIQANRKDKLKCKKILAPTKFDVVYDLAAFTEEHIRATFDVIDNKDTLYIYVSSSAVYGLKNSHAISEKTAPTPLEKHKYGENKKRAEETLQGLAKKYLIMRPSLVYGPEDSQEHLGYYFFQRIWQQIPLAIPGQLEVQNNFVFVRDLVELLFLSLGFSSWNMTINVGGPSFSWQEYLETLALVMQKELPPVICANLTLDKFKKSDYSKKLCFYHNSFYNFVLDTRLAQTCGWQAQYTLTDGLRETWHWLQQKEQQKYLVLSEERKIIEQNIFESFSKNRDIKYYGQ